MWMSIVCVGGTCCKHTFTHLYSTYYSPARMSEPTPTVTSILGPEPNAPLQLVGSITYDRKENGYNLEWETRSNFESWLTHEQRATGIEIRQSKTCLSKAQHVYLTCETFRCTHNEIGGVKPYQKKTMRERKINSKRIDGGCPCFIQIKTYPHTDTILRKYEFNHSHETSKNNLKYIRIRVPTWDLIEDWVRYGVTDQEIVSVSLCDQFISDQSHIDKKTANSIQRG